MYLREHILTMVFVAYNSEIVICLIKLHLITLSKAIMDFCCALYKHLITRCNTRNINSVSPVSRMRQHHNTRESYCGTQNCQKCGRDNVVYRGETEYVMSFDSVRDSYTNVYIHHPHQGRPTRSEFVNRNLFRIQLAQWLPIYNYSK